MEILLGQKVKDVLTGIEGVAVARTEFLYGCVRISVQPYGVKEGKCAEIVWVDEPQLEILVDSPAKAAAPAHGPRPDAVRRPDVSR